MRDKSFAEEENVYNRIFENENAIFKINGCVSVHIQSVSIWQMFCILAAAAATGDGDAVMDIDL